MTQDITAQIAQHGLTYGEGSDINTRYAAIERRKVMVIGLNPGDANAGTSKAIADGSNALSGSEKSWRTRCERLARAKAHEIVLTELVATPSKAVSELANGGIDFKQAVSENLENLFRQIDHHKPEIIFLSTISRYHIELIPGLSERHDKPQKETEERTSFIPFDYTCGETTIPLIAVRHISRNFRKSDRELVHAYVDDALGGVGVTRR